MYVRFEKSRFTSRFVLFCFDLGRYVAVRAHRNTAGELIYTFSGQWDYLCYNVTSYHNTTDKLEELIQENDETRWMPTLIEFGLAID